VAPPPPFFPPAIHSDVKHIIDLGQNYSEYSLNGDDAMYTPWYNLWGLRFRGHTYMVARSIWHRPCALSEFGTRLHLDLSYMLSDLKYWRSRLDAAIILQRDVVTGKCSRPVTTADRARLALFASMHKADCDNWNDRYVTCHMLWDSLNWGDVLDALCDSPLLALEVGYLFCYVDQRPLIADRTDGRHSAYRFEVVLDLDSEQLGFAHHGHRVCAIHPFSALPDNLFERYIDYDEYEPNDERNQFLKRRDELRLLRERALRLEAQLQREPNPARDAAIRCAAAAAEQAARDLNESSPPLWLNCSFRAVGPDTIALEYESAAAQTEAAAAAAELADSRSTAAARLSVPLQLAAAATAAAASNGTISAAHAAADSPLEISSESLTQAVSSATVTAAAAALSQPDTEAARLQLDALRRAVEQDSEIAAEHIHPPKSEYWMDGGQSAPRLGEADFPAPCDAWRLRRHLIRNFCGSSGSRDRSHSRAAESTQSATTDSAAAAGVEHALTQPAHTKQKEMSDDAFSETFSERYRYFQYLDPAELGPDSPAEADGLTGSYPNQLADADAFIIAECSAQCKTLLGEFMQSMVRAQQRLQLQLQQAQLGSESDADADADATATSAIRSGDRACCSDPSSSSSGSGSGSASGSASGSNRYCTAICSRSASWHSQFQSVAACACAGAGASAGAGAGACACGAAVHLHPHLSLTMSAPSRESAAAPVRVTEAAATARARCVSCSSDSLVESKSALPLPPSLSLSSRTQIESLFAAFDDGVLSIIAEYAASRRAEALLQARLCEALGSPSKQMWAVHISLKVAPALSPAQNSLLDQLCVRATDSLAKLSVSRGSHPGIGGSRRRISRPMLERLTRLLLLGASTLPASLRRFFFPPQNGTAFLEHLLTDWLSRGGADTFAVATPGVHKARTCPCFDISKQQHTALQTL
jgi:hypothetical protein